MKCPVCAGVDLNIAERQGVEIDYCPQCRGVWLDRGELDKILERSQTGAMSAPPEWRAQHEGSPPQRYDSHRDDHHGHGSHGYHRKKSWLAELFD